jgi:hypothetical protein
MGHLSQCPLCLAVSLVPFHDDSGCCGDNSGNDHSGDNRDNGDNSHNGDSRRSSDNDITLFPWETFAWRRICNRKNWRFTAVRNR